MDAREAIARWLVQGSLEGPRWEHADELLRQALLAAADEIIKTVEKAGYSIVLSPVRTNPGMPQEEDWP